MNPSLTYYFNSPEESRARLRELILYISEKCQNDPKFGATKLNKILLNADRLQYISTGKSITGGMYKKIDHGPVPHQLKPARESLRDEGALVIQELDYYTKTQKKPVALKRPDLSIFRGDEIATIDYVIEHMTEWDATTSSKISHDRAYEVCTEEFIPYEYAFISDEPITEEEACRIKELNDLYGWEPGN